jgi:ADP-heptose:LPS heptosyltransferase
VPVQPASEQAAALAGRLLTALDHAGEAPEQAIGQLCAMAAADDPAVAHGASQALFQQIVEPLGDRFEPAADALYVRFFSRVIDYCRRLPSFSAFDALLREFGIRTRQQLIDRAMRIRSSGQRAPVSKAAVVRVKTILVLSRVTLGADIAVTSVILSRMKAIFPNARVVLLGNAKAGLLFASDPRVELVETTYLRGGTLRDRLEAWVALCQSVAKQLEGLAPDEYRIVDPDSRMTQLGLLPLGRDDSRYSFFESRSFSRAGVQSLAMLTGCWLVEVFGPPQTGMGNSSQHPYVALPEEDLERGIALKAGARGRLAAVNLGVGGNLEKRVADPFEAELLAALLEAGYTLVVDRGSGEEELQRTGRLIERLQSQGRSISRIQPAGSTARAADVFVWEGSLSGFGGIVASAGLYCGYDSAGGHLAAALGVPVIDIFTDAAPPRMRERWSPWGPKPVGVLTAPRLEPRKALDEFRAALREPVR